MTQIQESREIAYHTQYSLYDQDFLLWNDKTANILRAQKYSELELKNLIEEIEDMGRSNRSAMRGNLLVLLLHLLKWKYQPEKRFNSWKVSIREHLIRIAADFKDSPSLKNYLKEILTKSHQNVCKLAADQTDLEFAIFPKESPFTLEEILDPEFLP
jgi:Domain of unknown function DUF29